LRAALERSIAKYDRPGSISTALEALDTGAVTIAELYDLLSETLVGIGGEWQRGAAEVWEEHLVTGVVRGIVEAMALKVEEAAPDLRRATVVLAAPSDEYHDLGLRMLADRFAIAGWHPYFLGANVPLPELVRAVGELAADAVALSASTHFHRVRVKSYVDGLSREHPDVRIWVGGPAFAIEDSGWPSETVLDGHHIPDPVKK
jgi:methanogenic corrinoid protein MtbC1